MSIVNGVQFQLRFSKLTATLIIFFILYNFTFAEESPVFEHLSINDGLSSSTVFSILQDDGGFMWFGTVNGLNKYDGYTFKIFEYDPADSTTISNTSAGNIIKDHEGYIWVGTWGGGLNRFSPLTNTAVRYQHDPKNSKSISGNRVQCIFEDSQHRIWAGTYASGLNLLDTETGTFTHYKHEDGTENSLSNNRIWSIAEDSLGYLWIGTSYGLNRLEPKSGKIKQYFADPRNNNSLSHNTIRIVSFTNHNELWVGTENGLNKYNYSTKKFERFFYQPKQRFASNKGRINAIYEVRKGDLYLGTGFGIVKFDPETYRYERYVHDPARPGSLGDNEVRCIFEDRIGVLWIGNRGRGIDKFNPNHKKFHNLTFSSSPEQDSKENTIFTVRQIGDDLYLNNFSSILRYNRTSGELFRYKNLSGLALGRDGSRKRTLYHSQIDTNILWISIGSDVVRFNIRTHETRNYILPATTKNGIPFKRVITIYEQDSQRLWLGNFQGGIRLLDTGTGKILRHYSHIEGDPASISHNEIWFIKPAEPGFLWIGTGKGLNLLEIKTGRFKHYFFDKEVQHSSRIFTFYKDKQNILWLGTDYGLLRFNPKNGNYTNYTKQQGLPDNQIAGICQDSEGAFWLTTLRGLAKFNPVTGQSTNFSVDDGLLNQEYLPGSMYQNKQGEIFAGGMKGLDYFLPEEIKVNTQIPPVVLTDLEILNKSVKIGPDQILKTDIAYTKEIVLHHYDYLFSLKFAVLDFSNSKKNKYAYKLEGFDSDWIYTNSTSRTAAYTTLPGGTYTFKVKGANADGIWNEEGVALKIIIVPPYWQTIWFRLIMIVLIIGLVVLFYKIRTMRIKKRSRELRMINHRLSEQIRERKRIEQEKEKLHAQLLQSQKMEALGTLAGGVAHDFNNILTVINGHAEIALLQDSIDLVQKKHFTAIQESGRRAEELTRQLLAFGRKQLVQAQIVNLNQVIEKTEAMLRRLISEDIQMVTDLSGDIPNIKADPSQIEQVLMNLIINARDAIQDRNNNKAEKRIEIKTEFKEAGDSMVNQYAEKPDMPYVMLSITDTGTGMDDTLQEHIFEPFFTTKEISKGTGLGLATVYGIVRQNEGSIFVISHPGEGSVFCVLWPASSEETNEQDDKNYEDQNLEGTERILLVEDNRAVLEFTSATLEEFGYSVELALNGKEALDIIKKSPEPFDLIVTDLIMPEMNGQELIEQLEDRIETDKVLFVSGYTFDHLLKEGWLREDIHFLKKPYSVKAFVGKIRQILDNGL